MKTIRITAPLVQHGNVQFLKGRVRALPDELADALIARGEAELVPTAEHATMVRRSETAVVPRPAAKPKAKAKGR